MPIPDEEATEAASEAAWQAARRIVAGAPIPDWPDLPASIGALTQFLTAAQSDDLRTAVRRALNEAYFYGLIYGFTTLEMTAETNGIRLRMPALIEALEADAGARLISYETMLPFLERDVSARDARWLADRFRGLARLCDNAAKRGGLDE